jgi:hypothetical protein
MLKVMCPRYQMMVTVRLQRAHAEFPGQGVLGVGGVRHFFLPSAPLREATG